MAGDRGLRSVDAAQRLFRARGASGRLCADKGHSAGRDLAAEDGTTLHKLNIKGGRFSRADDKNDITLYFGISGGIDKENRNRHAVRSMACRRSKKGS